MSATIRKSIHKPKGCPDRPAKGGMLRGAAACALALACVFATVSASGEPRPVRAATVVADQPSATAGRSASSSAQNATRGASPSELLFRDLDARTPTASELLTPGSPLWAGASALTLRLTRPELLLADGVISCAGSGSAAAAARPDGSILVFAPGNGSRPRTLAMPGGHPAFALGFSGDGSVLAAWSQGTGEIVFFDLASGSAEAQVRPLRLAAPLSGEAMLTLSADGQTLVAHDGSGSLWAGVRGGDMRPLGTLPGRPAVLAFSAGGGVLVAMDSSGSGTVWNPRTGKPLRSFTIPGGPFVRGDVVPGPSAQGETGQRLRLWTEGGALLRWDLLRGAVDEDVPGKAEGGNGAPAGGLLQMRGTRLFYVGEGRSWSAAPDYEPLNLALSWSREQRCLRLVDLDGAVRYYSAEDGAPRPQCFAVDWSPVEIGPDGGASVPGLRLRLFDRLAGGADGSQVNARAISSSSVRLWASAPAQASGERGDPNSPSATYSQSAADKPRLVIPLRGGLADQPATRLLHLGR